MNRRQMIDFINTEVLPGAEIDNGEWLQYGREIFWDILRAIEAWRIGKPIDICMKAHITDGVLVINGTPVKRVAGKLPRVTFSDYCYYIEGKILDKEGH